MNQNPSTAIETVLDEGITGGEMLEDILISDIVQLDNEMFVGREEVLVERKTEHGDDVCDVGGL